MTLNINDEETNVKLRCLFITRPHEPETPELLAAWDEFSADENPRGMHEDFDLSLAAVEGDYDSHGIIDVEVSMTDVLSVLKPRGIVAGKIVK